MNRHDAKVGKDKVFRPLQASSPKIQVCGLQKIRSFLPNGPFGHGVPRAPTAMSLVAAVGNFGIAAGGRDWALSNSRGE